MESDSPHHFFIFDGRGNPMNNNWTFGMFLVACLTLIIEIIKISH